MDGELTGAYKILECDEIRMLPLTRVAAIHNDVNEVLLRKGENLCLTTFDVSQILCLSVHERSVTSSVYPKRGVYNVPIVCTEELTLSLMLCLAAAATGQGLASQRVGVFWDYPCVDTRVHGT